MTVDGADRLIRRLSTLGDDRQRAAILAEEFERLGSSAFADLLSVILERATTMRRQADHIALAAIMVYLDPEHLVAEHRLELVTACREGGHRALMRLLVAPTGHRTPLVEKVPDYGAGRSLTLGERKSLARQPSRLMVERILVDPHPAVIRNVLQNPKVTESDVVRLVSKRPNYDKVLEQIYKHSRWNRRYPIRLALARNPYTPPTIVLKLLPQLLRQDLTEIIQDRQLHPSVVLSARRLLEGEEDDGEGGEEPTLH